MRILPEWVDEPFPLVECEAHTFYPFADLRSAHVYRCKTCGRLAVDYAEEVRSIPHVASDHNI